MYIAAPIPIVELHTANLNEIDQVLLDFQIAGQEILQIISAAEGVEMR